MSQHQEEKKDKKESHDDQERVFVTTSVGDDTGEPGTPKRRRAPRARAATKIHIDPKVDAALNSMYRNTDGSMPDMRQFEKRRSSSLTRAVVTLAAACLFLGSVVWAGFFVLEPSTTFSEEDVILSISGEEQVSVGVDTSYRIRYRNTEDVPLQDTTLTVRYPDGFIFVTSTQVAANATGDEWDIGTLAPDDSGYIDLVGRLYGDIGQKQSFRVFLNYTPTNFSSEFQKVATMPLEVVSAPLAIDVVGVTETAGGKSNEIVVRLSPSGQALEHVSVVIDPTDRFVRRQTLPAPDTAVPNRWSFPIIQDEKAIMIKGTFLPSTTDTPAPFTVSVYGWEDKSRQGDGYLLAQKTVDVPQVISLGTIGLAINGTSENFTLSPGEDVQATVSIKNTEGLPLQHLSARLVFDAPSAKNKSILDWSKIQDENNGVIAGEQLNTDTRRGSIVWDERQVAALRTLAPNGETTLTVVLPIKSAEIVDLTSFTTSEITAVAEIQYELNGKKEVAASLPLQMKLRSDVALAVKDSNIVSGGKDVHTISWVLTNTFHELKDIRIEADVYGDVSVPKEKISVPAGQAVFDPQTKKMVWTIPQMPTAVDVLALQFEVVLNSINPTQTNLTSKTSFKATDTVLTQDIVLSGEEIKLEE